MKCLPVHRFQRNRRRRQKLQDHLQIQASPLEQTTWLPKKKFNNDAIKKGAEDFFDNVLRTHLIKL